MSKRTVITDYSLLITRLLSSRSLPPFEYKDRSANRNLIAMPQSGQAGGAAVDQDRVGAVLVFDFAVIADRAEGGVQVGHQRIVKEIDIAFWRSAELHGVFEEEE